MLAGQQSPGAAGGLPMPGIGAGHPQRRLFQIRTPQRQREAAAEGEVAAAAEADSSLRREPAGGGEAAGVGEAAAEQQSPVGFPGFPGGGGEEAPTPPEVGAGAAGLRLQRAADALQVSQEGLSCCVHVAWLPEQQGPSGRANACEAQVAVMWPGSFYAPRLHAMKARLWSGLPSMTAPLLLPPPVMQAHPQMGVARPEWAAEADAFCSMAAARTLVLPEVPVMASGDSRKALVPATVGGQARGCLCLPQTLSAGLCEGAGAVALTHVHLPGLPMQEWLVYRVQGSHTSKRHLTYLAGGARAANWSSLSGNTLITKLSNAFGSGPAVKAFLRACDGVVVRDAGSSVT